MIQKWVDLSHDWSKGQQFSISHSAAIQQFFEKRTWLFDHIRAWDVADSELHKETNNEMIDFMPSKNSHWMLIQIRIVFEILFTLWWNSFRVAPELFPGRQADEVLQQQRKREWTWASIWKWDFYFLSSSASSCLMLCVFRRNSTNQCTQFLRSFSDN